MKTDQAEILVANTSAVFKDGKNTYRIVKGRTTARRGAKILKGREHLFSPLVVDHDESGPTVVRRGRPRKVQPEPVVDAFPVDVVEDETVEVHDTPDETVEAEPEPKKKAITTSSVKPKEK